MSRGGINMNQRVLDVFPSPLLARREEDVHLHLVCLYVYQRNLVWVCELDQPIAIAMLVKIKALQKKRFHDQVEGGITMAEQQTNSGEDSVTCACATADNGKLESRTDTLQREMRNICAWQGDEGQQREGRHRELSQREHVGAHQQHGAHQLEAT